MTTPCTLGVFTGSTLQTGRLVTVRFAPTADACPAPVGAAIAGGGADQANHAIYDWGLQLCQKPHLQSVTYIPANSQDGRENYINGLNDFAVTAVPFTDAEQSELAKKHREVKYAPVTSSGLVLAYKIFSQGNGAPGAQVTDLRLTPQLAAQIFTGQLTNWQTSTDMTALNPGDRFPPTVRPAGARRPLDREPRVHVVAHRRGRRGPSVRLAGRVGHVPHLLPHPERRHRRR